MSEYAKQMALGKVLAVFLRQCVIVFRLDLDKWINEPPEESSADEEQEEDMFSGINDAK